MPVTNNHVVEDYNKEWERLSQLHMRQTTIPPKNDASSYVFIFPLSFVVKKCYDYAPLNTLADAFVPYVSDKVRHSMQFQVIFLPNGYSHREHNDYLTKKAMPHHRPILTWKNAKEWTVENFQNAAISFLSEPFLPEQQSQNSDDMANHQDTSVINSIHINSSIWVIGPFIPTSDEKMNSGCQSISTNTTNALEWIDLLILVMTAFCSISYRTQSSEQFLLQKHNSYIIRGFTQCLQHYMERKPSLK